MSAHNRLYISTKGIEINKPSGGGRGEEVPYILFIAIDGVPALQLDRHHFQQPGQMAALTDILKEISTVSIGESKS